LQFNALGLLQHSKSNWSVKHMANYWSLTPYGHTRLGQLRALQAGEESLLRPDYPAALEEEAEAEVPVAEED
jgi:hypothetical protein